MFNKHNFSLAEFAGKEGRYNTDCIRITPEETVATNGVSLVKVTLPKESPDKFPPVDGVKPSVKFKPFCISAAAAARIGNAIPNEKSIPALNFAALDGKRTDAGENAVFAVSDLETPQVFSPKKSTGEYPKYQTIVPDKKKADFSIVLDAAQLAKLANAAAKFKAGGGKVLRLYFTEPDSAVLLEAVNSDTGQTWTGVLMPIRMEDNQP